MYPIRLSEIDRRHPRPPYLHEKKTIRKNVLAVKRKAPLQIGAHARTLHASEQETSRSFSISPFVRLFRANSHNPFAPTVSHTHAEPCTSHTLNTHLLRAKRNLFFLKLLDGSPQPAKKAMCRRMTQGWRRKNTTERRGFDYFRSGDNRCEARVLRSIDRDSRRGGDDPLNRGDLSHTYVYHRGKFFWSNTSRELFRRSLVVLYFFLSFACTRVRVCVCVRVCVYVSLDRTRIAFNEEPMVYCVCLSLCVYTFFFPIFFRSRVRVRKFCSSDRAPEDLLFECVFRFL